MAFTVRDLETYDEMANVLVLQRQIWGLTEAGFGLYPPLLNSVAKNGGLILGAFDAETDDMVGFLFGFLGREEDGPLKLCSQTMGVLSEWRRQGVAEALKRAQKERVIRQDLPLITWTYDPLEGPNANLNLHKLRAISRRYYRNLHGSNLGAINAGLPTDRLLVEWWICGNHANDTAQIPASEIEALSMFEIEGEGDRRQVRHINLDLTAPTLWLDSVSDIQAVKTVSMELAMDWRLKVRQALETYFDKGYIATDFYTSLENGQRHNRYLLRKATPALEAEVGITK